MNHIDGTVERVTYADSVVGEIGRDHDMGKSRVFKWSQRPFYSKNGYAMSEGLFEFLQDEDVEYVYVGEQYHHLQSIHGMERLMPDDEVFDGAQTCPSEPQYIVK